MEMTRDELIAFGMKRIDAKLNHLVREGRVRESDADDARQDAIVAVLEQLNDYDAKREVREKTFVNAVIKNALKYFFASRKYQKRKDGVDIDSLSESEEPMVNDVASGEMSELDHIYLKLDIQVVREKLPEKLRPVFDLLGEYPQSDIADLLKLSEGEVSKRIQEIRDFFEENQIDIAPWEK